MCIIVNTIKILFVYLSLLSTQCYVSRTVLHLTSVFVENIHCSVGFL